VPFPRFHWPDWKRLARETAPVAAAFVLGILYFRILVLMMSIISTPRETGLFVTSSRIMEMVAGLPLLLTGVALPVVAVAAHENPARLHYVLQRMTEIALTIGTLLALLIALAAEPVIVLLGGEEYRDAAKVLRVQGLSIVTIFLIQAWVVPLIATHEQRRMAAATAVGLAAVTALGAALIAPLDASGAALAAALGDAILAAAMLVALRAAGPGRGLSFRFAWRVVATAAIALTPLLVPGLPDAVDAVLGGLLFLGAAWVLRLVPSEVTDALKLRRA
jgi:O-antigen/teichoic acid export membrane protein